MKKRGPVPSPAIAFLLFLAAFLLVFPSVTERIASGDADFAAFYGAAVIVREGNAQSLYDYQVQKSVQQRYLSRPNPLAFYHPPFELLVFVPLTFLAFLSAFRVWAVLNVLLLAATWHLLRDNLKELPARQQWLLLWGSSLPVMATLVQGQDSLLLLFLYVLAWQAFQKRREFLAGCTLALGLFKFHLVVPFVLVLALRKQGRVVSGFLAGAALLVLISLWMIGASGVADYAALLLHVNQSGFDQVGAVEWGVRSEMMPNARGFLFSLSQGLSPGIALAGLAIFSLAALFGVAWVWGPEGDRSTAVSGLRFAATLTATLVVSYHLHLHDLVLLLLPAVLLVQNASAVRGRCLGIGLSAVVEVGLALFLPACLLVLMYKLLNSVFIFVLASGLLLGLELRYLREADAGNRASVSEE